MRLLCLSLLTIIAALCGTPPAAGAQDVDLHDRLKQITAASTLEKDGMAPWHIRITFQLYDLDGKKKDAGTVEEWWSSAVHRKVVIVDPSNHPGASGEAPPKNRREDYLIHQLLTQVVNPVPQYRNSDPFALREEALNYGSVKLSCLVIEAVGPSGIHTLSSSPHLCTEPGKDALRVYFESSAMQVVRNKIGKFRDVELGIDNTIAYNSKPAISGHVDMLEGFQPVAQEPESKEPEPAQIRITGGILAGRLLTRPTPVYPDHAKRMHLSGTVVLRALITKTGVISSLEVIASPDASLSDAAIEAVKHWTYQPYLLNGEPTEVDTTITVNFNLNGG